MHVLGHELTFNDWLYYVNGRSRPCCSSRPGWLLAREPGRAFRAIRDSEVAAASSGIDLAAAQDARVRHLARSTRASPARCSRSRSTFVNPDTYPIELSLFLLVGAVVAGLGSLWGIAFGALVIQYLPGRGLKVRLEGARRAIGRLRRSS